MKKVILGLTAVLALSSLAYGAQNNLNYDSNKKFVWEVAGRLPAQKGFKENVGTAGLLYGVIGDYLVVGGGANFPGEHLKNGGGKVTHKDLYLLKEIDGKMEAVDQVQLDTPIGYGASTTVGDAIYYLGGNPNPMLNSEVLKVTVVDGKIKTTVVGNLPVTFESGIAHEYNGKIYFTGKIGKLGEKTANSNRFFAYDIASRTTEELEAYPGAERSQVVGQILDGKFYVFSGGSSVSYVDGYAYDLKAKTWSKAADVVIDNTKIGLLGSNSIKLTDSKMLVIGGFNYQLWNDANFFLSNLKDEELAKYKKGYFGEEPFRYNWNTKALVFDAKENKWTALGEVPFDAPCGEALVVYNGKVLSINGEIKPGVRTNRIYAGTLIKK